jgi:hypothetical protein
VRLGIRLNKSDVPITRVMYYPTNALLTSVLAMTVVVLQHDDWLLPALAGVLDIASVKVAIVAVVSANWADPFCSASNLARRFCRSREFIGTFPSEPIKLDA